MRRIITVLLTFVMLVTGCGGSDGGSGSSSNLPNAAVTEMDAGKEDSSSAKGFGAEEVTSETPFETGEGAPVENGQVSVEETTEESEIDTVTDLDIEEAEKEYVSAKRYSGLNDPKLIQHVEDSVYSELVSEFNSEDYIIENVNAVYISKEYLEELDYNSKDNIFFGYTLDELDEQFQGTRYVFTLGEDGETVVQPFEEYEDDTYKRVLKNVAIGTGVIMVCVTISVVTGGVGLSTVRYVFALSADGATTLALSSSFIGAISAGTIEAIRTGDLDSVIKAAAVGGSEGFKWGAIIGSIDGGASALSAIHRASKAVEGATEFAKGTVEIADDLPAWRQAELRALNEYGGYEQLSYLNGEQVPAFTEGATRPDIIRNFGDHLEAVEVKYYDLENPVSVRALLKDLRREVSSRVGNLPRGSTQRIILDVTGRGFSETTCTNVVNQILTLLADIYPNIPIEIVGLL